MEIEYVKSGAVEIGRLSPGSAFRFDNTGVLGHVWIRGVPDGIQILAMSVNSGEIRRCPAAQRVFAVDARVVVEGYVAGDK